MYGEVRYAPLLHFHKCLNDETFDSLFNYILLRIVFTRQDTREPFVHYIVFSPYIGKVDLAQHPEMASGSYGGPRAQEFPRSIAQVIKEDARTHYGTEYHEYQP